MFKRRFALFFALIAAISMIISPMFAEYDLRNDVMLSINDMLSPETDIPDEALEYTVTYDEEILSAGTGIITLTFGGDCVLASDVKDRKDQLSFEAAVQEKGMDWFFSGVLPVFEDDDLSMINLECVLAEDKTGYKKRQHNFRGLPEYTNILKKGSIEAVNIANNHHVDYSYKGKQATRRALENAGIRYSGYGHFDIYEKHDIRIGFGGMRETIYLQNPSNMHEEIKKLKESGCNYIVYSLHFGKEYEENHNELQEKMAREAIDSGADLVVGTHTHVVQGIERYNNGLIIYSLGNLVFGGNLNLEEFDAIIARVELSFSGYKLTNTELKLIPIHTSGSREINDFRPVFASGENAKLILSKIAADSEIEISEHMFFQNLD
ncbi:MAG: CapA family protein [Christensenellales bacterium]|jgi:hypothetical protein